MHLEGSGRYIAVLALLLFSYSMFLQLTYSQNKPSMIVGGVDLSIGMRKEEVISVFGTDRFKLTDLGNDAWRVFSKSLLSDKLEIVGVIQFVKGRLYLASRDWGQSEHKEAIELFSSLFSALGNVTDKAGRDAIIQTYQLEQPGISDRIIDIHIGGRTFSISISKDLRFTSEQVEIQELIQEE